MIAAVASASASVMVVAKLFQLFHPIGGVGASSASAPPPADQGNSAPPAAAPPSASRLRRLILASLISDGPPAIPPDFGASGHTLFGSSASGGSRGIKAPARTDPRSWCRRLLVG